MPRVTPSSSDSDSSSSDVSLSDNDSATDSEHDSSYTNVYGLLSDAPYPPDSYICPCNCEDLSRTFYPGTYPYGYPCDCPPDCFCECSLNAMIAYGAFD